jgi:hypothetical protein
MTKQTKKWMSHVGQGHVGSVGSVEHTSAQPGGVNSMGSVGRAGSVPRWHACGSADVLGSVG